MNAHLEALNQLVERYTGKIKGADADIAGCHAAEIERIARLRAHRATLYSVRADFLNQKEQLYEERS